MVTQLTVVFFVSLLAVLWMRGYKSFPVLARKFLCLAPFLALVSLLNHNVDSDRWGTTTRILPIYFALLLLFLSLLLWRARGAALRFGAEELFLGLYILVCAAQIPGSANPVWALSAWSWSAPGYLLFLMAGRATSKEEFAQDKLPAWTLLGFIGISLALVVVGLLTGRADILFHTRNFGSIYASTAMLMFLMLFIGMCWVTVSNSKRWSFVVLFVSFVCMLMSLSRTAIAVLAAYLAVIFTGSRTQMKQAALALTLVCVTLGVGLYFVGERIDLDVELFQSWSERWGGGDYASAYGAARALRESKFSGFRAEVFRDAPWHGQGFGTFRHFSEYTDAHDLLVTEAFENSLLAAVLLVLAYSLPNLIRGLLVAELRPVAVSILGFIILGQVTGAMLSYRAEGHYYTAYPGWTLFYLIGYVCGQLRLRSQRAGAITAQQKPPLGSVMHAPQPLPE